ncbi:MAG: hypothetical protein JEY71_11635 [Sphaerochaeta sp.]|nr:hypothetical protein [Sphaerochaeta sp.]
MQETFRRSSNEENSPLLRFVDSEKITKYLKHAREIPKSILSSIVSVTNPDRSTAYFNDLLISNDWEEKEAVKTHFGLLKTMFC